MKSKIYNYQNEYINMCKTAMTLLIALFISLASFAQSPGINYKAVIKDDSGNVMVNQNLKVKLAIIDLLDNVDYEETHTTTTDANGIIILIIGDGTEDITGNYSDLDWPNGFYRLQVDIDIAPYDSFITMGTTAFQAVPYAYSSMDNLWQLYDDNAIALAENIGIGTDTPTELLHIYNDDKAAINLEVSNYTDQTQIEFRNGSETGFHSFYRILNQDDDLRFELDTDLSGTGEGYESKMTLSNSGLELENGTRINEFSTDGTLAGNSNNAIPTEAAVKAYVDNRGQSNYWKNDNLNTNYITATSTYQPIGPVLIINKEFSDSNIEVTLNSRVNGGVFSSPSVNGINFKIRIDGIETTLDNIGSIIDSNTIDFLSIFAVFEGLSVGSHTIQVYASTAPFGTSSNVGLDPGGWNGAIIAKETF
ncbi:hypothetical protein [Winogradskyella costae]|uniref:hypothetical protein n=1 Tax=Winogradskyella costae TaxID=2697008 RepID=UPI0015CEEE7E|nr:hypothetical protein [Winogradskyella costae]